jgi:Protein of unknown function (DUF3313)
MKQTTLALLAVVLTTGALAAETPATDGLVPVTLKNVDHAWQRPDANLGRYQQVLIRPATVAFSSNWHPREFGENGIKAQDVERLRGEVTEAAHESFARVLSKRGYATAAAPGSDVLEVQVEIVDLYVNGPDTFSTPLFRVYVPNVGQMRVVITLRDSVSGAALYRLSDRWRGEETGRLELATSAYNRIEIERLLAQAARSLHQLLNKT